LPLSNTFRGDMALAGPHPRNLIQSMGTAVYVPLKMPCHPGRPTWTFEL